MMELVRAFLGDAFIAAFAVFTVGAILAAAVFVNLIKDGSRTVTVIVKGLGSLQFFLLGLIAEIVYGNETTGYIPIALGLGLLGDILLEVSEASEKHKKFFFALGALLFAGEHVVISVNLIIADTSIWLPSLIFAVAAFAVVVGAVLLTKPVVSKKTLVFGLAYFILVCVMGGCCFGTAISAFTEGKMCLMIGGILFIVSDALLAVYKFSKPDATSLNTTLLYLYYIAQILIASCLVFDVA